MSGPSDLSQYTRDSSNGLSPPKHSRSMEVLITSQQSSSLFTLNNQENELHFCDTSSVDEAIDYLDKEFQTLGLGTLYSKQEKFELPRLLNTTYKLLRRQLQSSKYREDLENRIRQYSSDLDHAHGSLRKSKHSNTSLQNEIDKLQEHERQRKKHAADLSNKLKSHTEEIRRLKSQLHSNENQYRHELRKKEKQLDQIKERAHYLLSDKSRPGGAAGIDISSCLNRADGSRGKWRIGANNRNEEELQNRILVNMEMRCASLLIENNNMRQMLSDVHRDVTQLTSSAHQSPEMFSPSDEINLPEDIMLSQFGDTFKSSWAKLLNSLNRGASEEGVNGCSLSPIKVSLSPGKQTRNRKKSPALSCSLDSTGTSSTPRYRGVLNTTYVVEETSRSPRSNRTSPRKQERITEHINQLKKALNINDRSPIKSPNQQNSSSCRDDMSL